MVRNKIVGGEVYKTRGIRNNPAIDYERDFAEFTDLDVRLREWVAAGGAVRIINDGPMAAFTAAVEMAASPDARDVARGVFAHTLGTELGTGWVTETGAIPDIPLEVYNFIIDLGCRPERAFEPDDLRSLNNFNTGLPGTLQKYCSQSGVFRLALKRFSSERPDLLYELEERGFVERRPADGAEGWYVPTEPMDQRKPFLEHMMKLPDREKDDTNREIWREIGEVPRGDSPRDTAHPRAGHGPAIPLRASRQERHVLRPHGGRSTERRSWYPARSGRHRHGQHPSHEAAEGASALHGRPVRASDRRRVLCQRMRRRRYRAARDCHLVFEDIIFAYENKGPQDHAEAPASHRLVFLQG